MKSIGKGLVFWQPCLSPHQAPYLRGLQRLGMPVTAAVDERLPLDRIRMGWSEPDYGAAEILVAPTAAERRKILTRQDWIHIFTPARAFPHTRAAFEEAVSIGAQLGIFSEPYNYFGLKGIARRVRGHYDAIRYRRHVAFILAVGHMARTWFTRTGFPSELLYPFGYFTDRPTQATGMEEIPQRTHVQVAFVGSLLPGKRVDLLLSALATIESANWELVVVGDGPERGTLERQADRLGIRRRIRFLGFLPSTAVGPVLHESDALVLPSAWDGWGAVVNEALMAGTPAICSDRCGAADLLQHADRGEVFSYPSVEQLAAALERRIRSGPRTLRERRQLQQWSERITGDAAAEYVLDVVRHVAGVGPRPVAPWMDTHVSRDS